MKTAQQYQPANSRRWRCKELVMMLERQARPDGGTPMSYAEMAARLGCTREQCINIVETIEAEHAVRVARRRDSTGAWVRNVYYVLVDWVVRLLEGIEKAPTEKLATATPQEGSPIRRISSIPPLFGGPHLDHHPTL